jgi:hypothetical protein
MNASKAPRTWRKAAVLLLLGVCFNAAAGIDEPVRVTGGLVSGTPSWGEGVRMFRGIPRAAGGEQSLA